MRAFVCDLTRVGTLYFNESQGPTFPWLYGGDTTAAWRGQDGREYIDWHDLIHLGQPTGASSDSGVPNLVRGDRFYASMFARLVETLAATPDVDGASSMLDNTLCLWMTDFGHENHGTHNIPAVMAGLGTSYQKGRHLNVDGYTVGDLFATVLHLLGAPDTVRVGLEGPIDWSSLSETWAWSGSSTELFQRGLLPL